MDGSHQALDDADAHNPARRRVLAGLLSTYTLTFIPWAAAQAITNDDHGAFLALSAILAGRKSLDSELAARFYQALQAEDANFPKACSSLLELINSQAINPLELQKALDASNSALARLPKKIVTAWFMGIVGDGDSARCLAYENALNAVIVSDVLKPPSYAYGNYGSWEKKPI